MNDNDWKLKVAEDLASIKTDIKHILKNMCPLCHYPELDQKLKNIKTKLNTDRKLILGLLFSYIPLLISLFLALYK